MFLKIRHLINISVYYIFFHISLAKSNENLRWPNISQYLSLLSFDKHIFMSLHSPTIWRKNNPYNCQFSSEKGRQRAEKIFFGTCLYSNYSICWNSFGFLLGISAKIEKKKGKNYDEKKLTYCPISQMHRLDSMSTYPFYPKFIGVYRYIWDWFFLARYIASRWIYWCS